MRCFTFSHGNVTEGIQTTLSAKNRRLVFLGSKGARCICQLVFFDRGKDNEPEIDKEGLVHFAYPTKRKFNHLDKRTGEKSLRERVVLKRAFHSPTKILLRVNTSTASKHKVNGRWQDYGGWPIEWVSAHGYSNGQRWCDDMVVMDDQDVIMIIPAGAGRSDRVVVRNDRGVITCLPEREYHELVAEHRKEMARQQTQQVESPEEVTPAEGVVEGDVENSPEENKENEVSEKLEAESHNDDVEKGKAAQSNSTEETVMHNEDGETIGA